ncbi:MAG: SusC/RagA family TonB-linked outer membrane protein [Bacteroidota bacterium]
MKYNYHFSKIPISLLIVLLSVSFGFAQEKTVTGTVTDGEDGSPLPGVNVLLKGTTTGAITDFDGNFSMKVSGEDATLVFSYIGYLSQEIVVGNQSTVNVALPLDVQSLAEVVVVGYGTQEKKEITSAVVNLEAKDFNQGNINNPTQLLQGKVPGLSISSKGTDPNGGTAIRLRGISTIGANTEPLVVIDGVIGASLDNVDPNDIESVNVLKDGSAAAIYGSRGSSGVILVTTKSGKAGGMKVDYHVYGSMDRIARQLEIFEPGEFVANGGNDLGSQTDWVDQVTRTGYSQVHNLSVSGGNETTTFRVAANYRDINGILDKSGFDQVNFRANLNHNTFDDRLNLTFNFSTTNRESNFSFNEALRYAVLFNPTAPVRNDDGSFFQAILFDNYNPLSIVDLNQNLGKSKRINYNGKIDFELTDGLNLTANLAQQFDNQVFGEYYPRSSLFRGFDRTGLARRKTEDKEFTLFEAYATYNRRFGNLNMTVSGGYSYQEESLEDFLVDAGNFPTDLTGFNALEWSADIVEANRVELESQATPNAKIIAFFGRANFSWDEAIFLNASLRREGSTKLGEGNKWGWFPAIGAGVNLNRYLEIAALDQLKVRAGFGVTGALPRDNGLSNPEFEVNYTQVNGEPVANFTQSRAANPDLKWEVKQEFNFGIDLSTANGKLTGALDLYTRNISDFIIERNVDAAVFGADKRFENAGELRTNGLELALSYNAIDNTDFQWTPGIVFSTYKSTLEEYVIDQEMQASLGAPGQNETNLIRVKEGEEIGQIWGPVFQGVADDGSVIFQDVNGDGQFNTGQGDALSENGDFAVLGNGLPDFEIGWTNTLTYKRFDLNVFFRGAFGHSLVNTFRAFYEPRIPGQINSYNRINSELALDNLTSAAYSSYYVEKANFLKLDNITLGYNFDVSNLNWFSTIRAYVNLQNPFVITDYTGIDPEPALQDFGDVDNGGRPEENPNVLAPGIDRRNNYFTARTYTIGLRASF